MIVLASTNPIRWTSSTAFTSNPLSIEGDGVIQAGMLVPHRSQMLDSLELDVDLALDSQDSLDSRSVARAQRPKNQNRLKQTIKGKGKRVLGASGNDVLDASKGKGRNVLVGKGGNDTLKGKKKDRLLGGGGRDRLDTRKGRKNILKGGGGNDTLFAGIRDTVFGNGGADTLNAFKGKGKNTLKGGGGADLLIGKMGDRLVGGKGDDEFVIINRKLPSKPLVIEDFQQGRDRLSVRNAPDGLGISDLAFSQQGPNTVVVAQGQDIAILENVTANQLTTADFKDSASEPETGSVPSSPPVAENVSINDSPARNQAQSTVTIQQNQYSITSLDAPEILLQFDLTEVNASNTVIADRNPSSTIGVFPGAIQEYVSGSGTLPFGVDPVPFVPDGAIELSPVDLRAERIQDASRNAFVTSGRDTIEYVFTDPSAQNNELLRLNLDFTSSLFVGFVPNFDPTQAVNSLEYIVENDLLAYAMRVQVAGTQLFSLGDVQNTQFSKTYIAQGNSQFRLVSSHQELMIEDQNDAASAGLFANAIENFQDELTGQSFKVGTLSTSIQGNVVTYAIANTTATSNSISRTATLNLSGTSFSPDLAVNNLPYILANDLLNLAFFR